jgi:hypothetical protein
MSNFSIEGLQAALGSPDAKTRNNALKVLAEWLRSSDPEKRDWAAKISAESLEGSVKQQDEASNQKRKAEIYSVFFAAHPELVDNIANRNLLETFAANNGGVITLDVLEQAAEQLSGLAKQRVPAPELTPEQALRAKLNAQKMREIWLRSLSTDELRKIARDEEQARKHGQDVNKDLRLTQDEKELLENQPKVSTTAARIWVPDSNPRREYTRQELVKLDARTIRSLITNGGHQLDLAKQQRFNDILGGVQPEGVGE